MHAAIGMASVAATQAYHTAKDVFHTLQAKNQYVPPQSEWKPSEDNWTPPKSAWTPPSEAWVAPQSEWQPQPNAWTPPQPEPRPREVSPMDQLVEMGFANRESNKKLLEKHNNDIEKVISELLQQSDGEWVETRH